jgi:hypothetical protein|tara:strand:+ start:1472 stop:1981 length:510 start_codon:yes stop_codon:yes gene_type:complete
MANTTVITMTGFLEYARVFTENMDDNMDFHDKTEGQYNVNFYPETDEDFDKFFGAGAPPSSMGHDTIKIGNPEVASGKYLKLKRPNKHPSGIEDFGGAPLVFDFREGESTKKWSFENDGELGNGTKATVKVSIYGEGPRASIRLEKLAVTNLVEHDGESSGSVVNKDAF